MKKRRGEKNEKIFFIFVHFDDSNFIYYFYYLGETRKKAG